MSTSPNSASTKLSALGVNCTLERGSEESSSQKILDQLLRALQKHDVESSSVRAVDHDIKPGVKADEGDGDAWPLLR